MSGWITTAGENYLLDLLTGRVAALPRYYVALVVNRAPSRFISGVELDEPIADDYARVEYPNSSDYWTATSGEVHNTVAASFPAAVTAWGTCRHWAVCTALAAGDVLWAGPISVPLVVEVDDTVVISPGALTLRAVTYTSRVSL